MMGEAISIHPQAAEPELCETVPVCKVLLEVSHQISGLLPWLAAAPEK